MKFKLLYRSKYIAGMLVLLANFLFVACNSSGLTKKQREAMDHYVDETADAIVFSATKVKKLLSTYKTEHGSWPKEGQQRRQIFRSIGKVLEEHRISDQKLVEIDNNEIIVEYELSASKFKQFPQLLESWVIVFSSEQKKGLEIVSIYPHWCDSRETSAKTSYSKSLVESLRTQFKKQLQDKLTSYSITLSEHISEES